MSRTLLCLASTALLASSASAFSTFPEIEPNESKAAATTNGIITLVAGDDVTGSTTGSSTVTPGAASSDYFRIKTGALPAGIYRHTMTLTTSGTAGHTGTIRGLNQTSGVGLPGVIGTTDSTFSTSSTTFARSLSWYGFGRSEELYYRVTGTASTTMPYSATLSTASVAPIVIPGTYAPGAIAFNFEGQTTTDTDIHLLDSNLTVIDDASNDDNSIAEGGSGNGLQSRLTRTLAAGTYYLAIGRYNTASNDNSPATDDFRTGNVLDFPNIMANSSTTVSTTTGTDFSFQIIDGSGTTNVALFGPLNEPWSIVFAQITVGGGIPPATAYCFGDGTGAACPCGNNGAAGNGCASSVNVNGANLASSGVASISNDTFTLLGSGMPNSSVLYFQGTTQVSSVFGDGLRCAGGAVIRLLTKSNVAGASQYPGVGETLISIRGNNVPGNVRTYQAWYRNAAAFCTVSTFNLTNGIQATWGA